jgi:hypothetical protein
MMGNYQARFCNRAEGVTPSLRQREGPAHNQAASEGLRLLPRRAGCAQLLSAAVLHFDDEQARQGRVAGAGAGLPGAPLQPKGWYDESRASQV